MGAVTEEGRRSPCHKENHFIQGGQKLTHPIKLLEYETKMFLEHAKKAKSTLVWLFYCIFAFIYVLTRSDFWRHQRQATSYNSKRFFVVGPKIDGSYMNMTQS